MTTVGIIQPNYLPWRGYFHFMQSVDVFIFLDDVQYTKQDWRNRNRIRTRDGKTVYLTVPVHHEGQPHIMDVSIDNTQDWATQHLRKLENSYGRAAFFNTYFETLSEVLMSKPDNLADLNITLTGVIAQWLGIATPTLRASSLGATGRKDERLIQLVRSVGGDHYLSGPAAQDYIQPELWKQAGVDLSYMTYPDYPAYPQISAPYDPAVSILDLLFAVGPEAPGYIWETGPSGAF